MRLKSVYVMICCDQEVEIQGNTVTCPVCKKTYRFEVPEAEKTEQN